MYKISQRAKFPLSISKGSTKQRFQRADKIMKNFSMDFISEINKKNEISVDLVKKLLLNNVSYKNISFDIKPISPENYKYCDAYIERLAKKGKINKYEINLPLVDKIKILRNKEQLTDLIHELWHMVEMVNNPKTIARYSCIEDNIYDKAESFFERYMYNWAHPSNKETKRANKALNKFLKSYDNETKINLLQMFRYDLQGEDNAERAVFNNFTKYHSKKKKYHPLYKEKIEILNQKLKEVITKQRDILKNKSE